MKAVVMAGGEGSRLRPLTVGRPKPMVPLVNKPMIGHILDLLRRHGITDVVITVAYMAQTIQDYFGNGQSMGLHIEYAVEERPLGTAGSVKNAAAFLQDTFLVISGDALTDFDLLRIIAYHREKGAKATVTLYRVSNPLEYGIVVTDERGRITQFLEKPSWGEVISDTVNTGIYVVEPEVLELVPDGEVTDWSHDVFPQLLQEPDALYGYVAEGYWTDVGTLQEYTRAVADVLHGRVQVEPLGVQVQPGVWVGDNVDIAPGARISGPVYLGTEVKVKEGVVIHGPTVIRDYCIVDNRVHMDHSNIWRNTYIGEAAELRGAIVGRHCSIKARAVIFEGAVVADRCIVGSGALIHPNVKLWPGKEVESGATVRSSIIWGSQGRRVLFGRFGVTGVVNVDLTPEFCARLGAAIGATLPKGAIITINRDAHRSSRMLKRALISGLPSAGVNVWDVGSVPIPVARYYCRVTEAAAGIHVRLSPFDQRVVDIRVFAENGMNLSKPAERNIEHIFFREDFRRAYMDDIGIISHPPNVVARYTTDFLNTISRDAVRNAHYKIVVDYAHAPAAQVLPDILTALEVDVVPLNAYVDESKMAVQEEEVAVRQRQLAAIVRVLGRDLGIQLDVGGEKLFLVDDRGEIVPLPHAALAVIDLALRYQPGKAVVVPVTMTAAVEKVAAFHGGYVIRTRYDLHDLMIKSTHEDVIVATDGRGHFIFPQFQPVTDGLFAAVKVLELMSLHQTRFSEVLAQVPTFHVASGQVRCPWEAKGKVMRLLKEQLHAERIETLDGIKAWFADSDWVLIRPDPDRPLFHVDAESTSAVAARELVDRYLRIVEGLKDT